MTSHVNSLCNFFCCLFGCLGCNKSTGKASISIYTRDFTSVLSVRGEIFSQNEISMSVPSGVGGSIKSIPESGTPVKARRLIEIESKIKRNAF